MHHYYIHGAARRRERQWNCLIALMLLALLATAAVILVGNRIDRLCWRISDQSATAVPKLLHFASELDLLPAQLGPLVNSCIALNPGWTVHLWTNRDVRLLLMTEWPELLKLYTSSVSQADRLAMAKYPVLYQFGGVFLDTSVECLKPLDMAVDSANSATFLALERPENHQILENSQFKLTPAAMGAPPGSAWFGHAIEVMQRRMSIGDDLSFDSNFPTECHLLWQRKQQQLKQPGAGRYLPNQSVYLLPWEYFSPTLRSPEAMLSLCRQLVRWPELGAIYAARAKACSSLVSNQTGSANATAVTAGMRPNEFTVGLPHHELLQAASKGPMLNASLVWPQIRRFELTMGSRIQWRSVTSRSSLTV